MLIDELAKLHTACSSRDVINRHQYSKVPFGIMEEYELMTKYVTIFKPITFDNKFNIKLLRILIDNGETKIAKQYCEKQILGNYREEYNVPYLEFLKEIYALEKDEANLEKVLSALFPYTYHFEDFLYIYDRINDVEEKKKWRTKILSRARNASNNYNNAATAFAFKLMNHEKRYSKNDRVHR